MAGSVFLILVLGLSPCFVASADLLNLGTPMTLVNSNVFRTATGRTTLTFNMSSCLRSLDPKADRFVIVVNTSNPSPTITTGPLPSGLYVVDGFAIPACDLASNMQSVYRLGVKPGSAVPCSNALDPIVECNPPLAMNTAYSINGVFYLGSTATSQLGWSIPATTKSARLSPDSIVLPPGGRSGGMVVITVILTILMALLIVLLIVGVLSSNK